MREMIMRNKIIGLVLLMFAMFSGASVMAAAVVGVISKGKTVKFHYTLTVDTRIVDSTRKGDPVSFVHGSGQMMPGLEARLEGMKDGDKKVLQIPETEGFGPIDPKAVVEVPLEKLPPGADKPGIVIAIKSPQGQDMRATVKEIREKVAVLDFNHPLAGKSLEFDVEIIEVI